MIPGSINGEEYPIALDESGNLQWQTVQVAQERDEVWEDWSLGLGETERTTGRGYFFARGWDASTRGALRLSPFFQNLNNTAFTTDYGYFMEGVETSGSTLTLDAFSTGKGSVTDTNKITFSHTVASQPDGILLIFVSVNDRTISFPSVFAGYAGGVASLIASKQGATNVDATLLLFGIPNPATGTNDVSISNFSGGTLSIVGGATSMFNVDVDDPWGAVTSATGTDGTPTVTVPTASGEQIVAGVAVEGSATIAAGTNETERWDDTQTTSISGSGYTQAGSDGGVMAPSLTSGTDWVEIAVSVKPASTTSRSIMQIADTTKIYKYTYHSDTGLTLDATDTTASGVAGRPAKMNGNWYVPMGSGASAQKITGVTIADVTGTWNADHLSTFQKGVTPTLARVNSTTQNTVELNADTGDITDAWTNESEKVGDTTTKITELLEAEGQLFVCKEDGLYRFGSEAESFPIIPFIDRGKIDADNGKGSFAFGDEIIYMSQDGLWRKRIGRGALPIGLNTIRSWRKIDDIIDTPKDGRPVFGVHAGEYWYYLVNDGEVSHLIQARKRRDDDPAGHELIQHSVLTIPLSKGLGKDSRNRLWIKGASADETTRDIRVIELAEDGSLDVQNRRGQADEVHNIDFDERNPGRPQDKVQIRHMTTELEGDWDSTTSLQLKLYRDNATTPTSIGSAITAAGMTVRNPTVGTSDTGFRIRPELSLTTNSSYTPKNSDPQVLRVIVGIRFPEIIRIVVNAEQLALDKTGLEAFEAEQNLRRLQNQGTVTFRRPGDYDDPATGTDLVTDRTFTGEVEGVTDIMYKTSEVNGVGSYAHGLELRVKRWITY